MVTESMALGIVLERREIDHPWESHSWTAVSVIPGAAEGDEWRVLAEEPGVVRYHAGTLTLEIHHKETEGYRLNLTTERPKVYIVLRYDDEIETGIVPFLVTVCPYEAQNYLDGDEDLVEPAPMPDVVAAWLTDFVARHHVDEPFYKRQRKPYDPRKGPPERASPRRSEGG
ncbi:MAG: DUF3305 domain-containing protein [Proteobacteria bacterium]|nr:DUF3305 domain-containing protein [Pseudomonadota bacterium]